MKTKEAIKTILYPYNKSFGYYAEAREEREAIEFVSVNNKAKGGEWVLHTQEQYDILSPTSRPSPSTISRNQKP